MGADFRHGESAQHLGVEDEHGEGNSGEVRHGFREERFFQKGGDRRVPSPRKEDPGQGVEENDPSAVVIEVVGSFLTVRPEKVFGEEKGEREDENRRGKKSPPGSGRLEVQSGVRVFSSDVATGEDGSEVKIKKPLKRHPGRELGPVKAEVFEDHVGRRGEK